MPINFAVPFHDIFPDMFVISSIGPAGSDQKSCMGTYFRVDGVSIANLPVWKKEGDERFIYYDIGGGKWYAGDDYTANNSPPLMSIDVDLTVPPRTKWKYKNTKNIHELDAQLQVEEENMKGERDNITTV